MGGATSRAQVQHEKDEQAEAYGADPSKGRRRGSGSRAVHDFNMIHVLDRSDEGALTLVRARDGEFSQAALCMREFRKGAVRSRLDAVLLERDILTGIPSPFLPAVVKAFEEVHSVFMVTKFYSGGPLKEHLRRNPKGLEPSRAAYYVAVSQGRRVTHCPGSPAHAPPRPAPLTSPPPLSPSASAAPSRTSTPTSSCTEAYARPQY